ncbi:hypothetical protein [Clostridium sp.]|uniref:hypothetical protein n=1 Tax=Clostridium sp. TaxID=1506 RepID=UPI0032162715
MDKLENDFRQELLKGDLAYPRGFLTNTVIWESTNKNAIERLIRIAEENEVFEKLNGNVERLNNYQWTYDYQDSVQTELMLNYSKERFLHFLEVANYLSTKHNERKINKTPQVNPKTEVNKKNINVQSETRKVAKKKQSLGTWIIIGLVLLVVILIMEII